MFFKNMLPHSTDSLRLPIQNDQEKLENTVVIVKTSRFSE